MSFIRQYRSTPTNDRPCIRDAGVTWSHYGGSIQGKNRGGKPRRVGLHRVSCICGVPEISSRSQATVMHREPSERKEEQQHCRPFEGLTTVDRWLKLCVGRRRHISGNSCGLPEHLSWNIARGGVRLYIETRLHGAHTTVKGSDKSWWSLSLWSVAESGNTRMWCSAAMGCG